MLVTQPDLGALGSPALSIAVAASLLAAIVVALVALRNQRRK